jgi:flagellar biosynthetic protein FliP
VQSAPESAPAPRGIRRVARNGLRVLRSATPLAVLLAILVGRSALAAPPDPSDLQLPTLSAVISQAAEPGEVSSTLQIVALVTLISVAPSILLMATCFTRIVIVLAFLRQAIGIQQLPPSQVLVGLALFLTLFAMAPVGEQIRAEALEPYMKREIDERDAFTRASVPVREFLTRFTRERDLELFVSISDSEPVDSLADAPLTMLLPAYMLSELRTAFEIGFMLYLPFLVIDLVVASTLISMGMIVLPPIVISLPFKLMLFVLLDGWNLVVSSLLNGLR